MLSYGFRRICDHKHDALNSNNAVLVRTKPIDSRQKSQNRAGQVEYKQKYTTSQHAFCIRLPAVSLSGVTCCILELVVRAKDEPLV